MNKGQLIDRLSEETGTTKANAEMMLENTLQIIRTELKSGKNVKLVGFGTFQKKKRKQRAGRNPQTGKKIIIPAHGFVKFSAGESLKAAVR
jgi:DNA-binding protein HU-beta